MMNSVTHMTVGGLTGGLVLAYGIAARPEVINVQDYKIYPLAVIMAAVVGGIAPDVDMPRSKAGKFLRKALRFVLLLCAILLAVMYFIPQTGIPVFDNAIKIGANIDRNIPLVLAGFCIFIMIIVHKSKHRGFTHTSAALAIIAAPLIYVLYTHAQFNGADIIVSAYVGFVLGWLSHMVIDTLNYPGTPWLWPLTDNHFNIMRIDSGTGEERIFRIISIVLFGLSYLVIIVII